MKDFMRSTIQRMALLALIGAPWAQAVEVGDDVAYLQQQWAIDNYQLTGKDQVSAFLALIDSADELIAKHPQDPALYIWRGIIQSTFAGVKGGLGALKYAKAARADFEEGIALDPAALDGSAYTSLGTLYSKVPGWPVGFGDDAKAEEMLKKGLELNPRGIDPNYFYGQFLLEEGRYAESREYLTRALSAEPRPGRELADSGRRREVEAALVEVQGQQD